VWNRTTVPIDQRVAKRVLSRRYAKTRSTKFSRSLHEVLAARRLHVLNALSGQPAVLVNAGIIDGVRNVVVYANIGHSVFSDDGGHFYAGGGFKVVIGR
jgi:hypothetical protein